MILEDNSLLNIIPKLNIKQQSELIDKIFNQVNIIHSEKIDDNWLEKFNVEINLSLFNHGLTYNPGLKDYVITDYLKENLFILKDRQLSRLIQSSSLLNMTIGEDLEINIDKGEDYGDKILDYVDINIIAYYYPEFASNLLQKLISTNHRIRFLKLFSIYSAKYTIDLIVKRDHLSDLEKVEEYNEIINFIIDSFDDFTEYRPNWLK